MIIDWAQAWPSVTAAFLASIVEFVEALTVILAVGTVRGWTSAFLGTGGALLVLTLVTAIFGPALALIPLQIVQLVVGVLLLLFGLRWLRKAVRRAAGIIPLRDEEAAFVKQTAALRGLAPERARWDRVAIFTAFQITMIEGMEVIFIVIAAGAGGAGLLVPASIGAAAALAVVIALGLLLHRPLSAIPQNKLKFAVGVLVCAFGTFWIGEGSGLAWPGGDWALPALVALYLLGALAAVKWSVKGSG